jgi:hypothetical protein
VKFVTVFKRYELKYLITAEEKAYLLSAMAPHMALDEYGRTTIRNVYYDTGNYRMIRRSIDRPSYKEKLRVRSYRQVGREDTVFVELKKKAKGIVYKRRIPLSEAAATAWVSGAGLSEKPEDSQIAREIDYVLRFYGDLRPACYLSYEREAYFSLDGSDFRVTFDENILARTDALSLCEPPGGTPLLKEGMTLMEIKCAGGLPLWMVHALSERRIYKSSFSKYGTAYRDLIYLKQEGVHHYGN